MSNDAAWAQLATATKIRQGERIVSELATLCCLLAERDQSRGRIIAAHTSSKDPR